jgi:autophagy-related protein 17
MELREFLNEMELKHETIIEYVASLNTTHAEITSTYQILDGVSARLPGYIIASQDFRTRWEDTKLNIQEQLNELESMRVFYENYQSSYDGLILEVQRRKNSEEKVRGIMRKAMEQIEKVYEVDLKEREGFRLDVGDFLPVDLWPDVNTAPARWEFGLVGGGSSTSGEKGAGPVEGDSGKIVPALGQEVVEMAARRDRERLRGER